MYASSPGGATMRTGGLILLAAILTALWTGPIRAATPLVYTMKTVERWDPHCPAKADAFHCAHIRFKYPVIERAPRPPAAAAINRAVRDFLLTSIGEPRRYKSIEAAMEAFMQEYQEVKKLTGATSAYWEERIVGIRYHSDKVVSLNFDLSFFSRGLHPQYAITFASFNATTGAKIRLADVLLADYEPRLTEIAEREFRASNGINPGVSLHDAGYTFFKDDRFALNDNFWIGPRGITFYYNPYEIAPWSMGATELLLTYREIGELIKPEGLLGSMR
jgi:hypothetical protein